MKAHIKINGMNLGSLVLGVIIAFFPKCAFCWAAYMSIFSTMGIASIPYLPWLQPVLVIFFIVNVFTMFFIARKRNDYNAFIFGVAGAMFVLFSKVIITSVWLTYLGLLMIVASSLWNLFTKKLTCNVEKFSGP